MLTPRLHTQARARLNLLPSLLPVTLPVAVSVTSAPDAHAGCASHPQEFELPLLLHFPSAHTAEQAAGKLMAEALALAGKQPEPEAGPVQLCNVASFMQASYARCVPAPELARHVSHACLLSGGSVQPLVCSACPQFLEPMLLPPFVTAAEVRSSVAAEALAECMPLENPATNCGITLDQLTGHLSFLDLLAADQV